MRFRLKSGLTLNYRTRGRGRTVVLLHPIGCQLGIWDGVIEELENYCRPIAVDFRGHGASDGSAEAYSLRDLAFDIIELVEAVGAPPAVVAGCSMGGMVAQAIAVEATEIVAGFVIANTGYTRNQAAREMLEARAKAAEGGMPGVIENTLARWFNERYRLLDPESVSRARNWLLDADPVQHAHGWRAIRDLDYAERLINVDRPSLAIAGTEDQSVGTDAIKSMAAALKNCTYHQIEGAGHLSPLEQPRIFARTLRDFLETLPD
ncbi:MAG: hypothetical protein RLZ98_188 [Pseudomonadota bacterium]|jgi:3-oxoadipate enol-lactonase